VIIPAFITAGWLVLIRRTWGDWRTHGRKLIVLVLMILAMLVIMFLALGPRGPEHGLFFRICRLIIPPYAMIRQPAKIFCLMPSLLAVASAVGLTALVQLRASRVWAILVPVVFAGLILWNYARQSNPTISLLEKNRRLMRP